MWVMEVCGWGSLRYVGVVYVWFHYVGGGGTVRMRHL